MASPENKKVDKNHSFIESFHYAWKGLRFAFKTERNLKIDSLLFGGAVVLGLLFHLSAVEWIVILFGAVAVFMAEFLNTVTEWLVDLIVGQHYRLPAKRIKDMAAGMVALVCGFVAIIGLVVFVPHIVAWVQLLGEG